MSLMCSETLALCYESMHVVDTYACLRGAPTFASLLTSIFILLKRTYVRGLGVSVVFWLK
jgi:hypothetical protein